MSDAVTSRTPPPATDADGKLLLTPDAARALLRECCAQFQAGLVDVLTQSIDGTNDLFEQNKFVTDAEILDFRNKRGEWVNRFAQTYKDLFEKRLAGGHRHGRRPDSDRSLASLRGLNAFDHDKQAALINAAEFLRRLTKRPVDALDLRVVDVIAQVCREFRIDASVFAAADAKLLDFVDVGDRKTAAVLDNDVAAAVSAGQEPVDQLHIAAIRAKGEPQRGAT